MKLQVGDIVKFSDLKTYEEYMHCRGLITNVNKDDNNYFYYTVHWFDEEKVYDGYSIEELIKVS